MGRSTTSDRTSLTIGVGSTVALLVVSWYAVTVGRWKLLGISWVAFVAMAGSAVIGARAPGRHPGTLVWGYGLASGAMITSAAVFLLPMAFTLQPQYGGFGVALGLLVGFGVHTVGHRLAHLELPMNRTAAELTAHAVSAGVIMGIVYGNMPALGPMLGLAIVSHKGPAGYAAASRLARTGRSWTPLLLPASGVGIAAIASSAVTLPAGEAVRGLVFGFAAGVFLHVAMDFLPRCETGSEIHDVLRVEGDAHALLDRLRVHAVASTSLGGFVVYAAWVALSG